MITLPDGAKYKVCSKCSQALSIDNFYKARRKNKKDQFQAYCKICCYKQQKPRYLKYRKVIIKNNLEKRKQLATWWFSVKSTFECLHCGENDPIALDFHHIDPTKKEGRMMDVSRSSKQKLTAELEKCLPLCSNCHRKLHRDMKLKEIKT